MRVSMRQMASVVLLIGGCTEREEGGALRSVEELTFSRTPAGINATTRIIGELQEARRSPVVFKEKNGFLVIGGCRKKGVHLATAERIQWNEGSLVNNNSVAADVIKAKSCAAFAKLNDLVGVIIGGFNGIDCLKDVELVKLNAEETSATPLADIPFRLKNSAAVSLPNGDVLLFGGWDENQTMKTVFRLRFNNPPSSYRVEMDAILPYQVEGHCCVTYKDYTYIIGGYDGVSVIDSIIRYSMVDSSSVVLPTRLSIARENHICEIIFDRYIVVMAGWDGRQALNSIEIFELIEESPYLIPVDMDQCSLCQARNRPVSVVVDEAS